MGVPPLLSLLVLMTTVAGDVSTRYDENTGRTVLSIERGGDVGSVVVLGYEGVPSPCDGAGSSNCFEFQESRVVVEHSARAGECVTTYMSFNVSSIYFVQTCTPFSGSHLYGGPEQYYQYWPTESVVYSNYAYVTKQEDNVGVAERYWLFSDGRYMHAAPEMQLFVNQNENDSVGCLGVAAQLEPPYPLEGDIIVLNETTCVFGDARLAHEDAVERFLGKPSGVPDQRMVTHPIWSTWARYKRDIDDSTVRQLAAEVVANGFNNSQIEIDDSWESCYGSLTFDATRFPSVSNLTRDLHDLGFRVTLWVHPFVNIDCEPFYSEALASGYFVTNTNGSANTSWWNGEAGVVDFTNPDAAAWWTDRLWTCTPFSGSHLYGGPEQYYQYWPTESVVYSNYAYVTKQEDNVGVAERYWLFSDGRYMHAAPEMQLFVNQNENDSVGCLGVAAQLEPPYPLEGDIIVLNETTCVFGDARLAHEDAVERFLGKPSGVPDQRMVTHPIWSTWARYKRDIDDSTVRQLAAEVVANGFNNSQIEIDDSWESCYGSLTFDATRFPSVSNLTRDLHDLGFRVTLWVHPFVNIDCEPFYSEALASGYFVTNTNGSANTSWWNGEAGVVDFTNPDAAAWWTDRLWTLRNETGIDSFKFDAGETSWLPQLPDIEPEELSPMQFTEDYVRTVSQFGSMIEVRVAARTQDLPVFVRMLDKDSRWGFDNGLPTLVTTLLQMNMVGYPFVLPDMVGGNGYGSDTPTKELFIRWLQATVFMPAIQFSYTPWDFDDETVELSRNLTALHAAYAPRILELMGRAVEDGSPVNPPIWWINATDATAQVINSEFLLGEDLLVAPVLEEGAVTRDIYLPSGRWRDEADPDHPVLEGPAWVANYSAPLSVLPYFTRLTEN